MENYSDIQEKKLQSLREKHPRFATQRFAYYLNEIPKEEPLDPRWLDFWTKFDPYKDVLSKNELEYIEDRLSTIENVDKEIFQIKINDSEKMAL